ncbi:hypothetical protein CTI12_AA384290 [Artemisia annua]|uniref:Serpin domain-containing protein n=1 Tax=Artemisia annua TaxID=35608 RepID=A0A2U1MFK2_ARTAN|nr:hypothetical protein CTI12_AA384290 [Artemisia annua]
MHHTMQHLTNYRCKHVLRTFSTTIKPSPVVSSPVVLALIAAGCKGKTQDQVLSFLQTKSICDVNDLYSQLMSSIMVDGSPFGGPRLSLPNGLWVEQTVSLKDSFKQVVDKIYKAECKQVDFLNQATKVTENVNAWAEDQTNGLIKKILSPDAVDNETQLIFANAVYFKGVWNVKFDPSKTKDYNFHLGDGSKHHIPHQLVKVGRFLIPKFKLSFEFKASKMMKELGLVLPFTDGSLTEMVNEPLALYVKEIFHKAFVEVNEEGTEAAAVTAAKFSYISIKPRPVIVDFVADHPFMFVIREDTSGAVMFMGQVGNPNIASAVPYLLWNKAQNPSETMASSYTSQNLSSNAYPKLRRLHFLQALILLLSTLLHLHIKNRGQELSGIIYSTRTALGIEPNTTGNLLYE